MENDPFCLLKSQWNIAVAIAGHKVTNVSILVQDKMSHYVVVPSQGEIMTL